MSDISKFPQVFLASCNAELNTQDFGDEGAVADAVFSRLKEVLKADYPTVALQMQMSEHRLDIIADASAFAKNDGYCVRYKVTHTDTSDTPITLKYSESFAVKDVAVTALK